MGTTRAELSALIRRVFEDEILPLCEAGQKEYTGGDAAFGNFERLALELGIPREKVLWVQAMKHKDGTAAWINGHRSQREGVEGRINDLILYLFILRGMIEEGEPGLSRPFCHECGTDDPGVNLTWLFEHQSWICRPCDEVPEVPVSTRDEDESGRQVTVELSDALDYCAGNSD